MKLKDLIKKMTEKNENYQNISMQSYELFQNNLIKSKSEIKCFLKEHHFSEYIKNKPIQSNFKGAYKIHPDLTVSIIGNAFFSNCDFEYFPIKFKSISGEIRISHCNNLKSLMGLPEMVNNINISYCDGLQDFSGCPKEILCDISVIGCRNIISFRGIGDIKGFGKFEKCGFTSLNYSKPFKNRLIHIFENYPNLSLLPIRGNIKIEEVNFFMKTMSESYYPNTPKYFSILMGIKLKQEELSEFIKDIDSLRYYNKNSAIYNKIYKDIELIAIEPN